jgi:hypothetical protein
MLEHDYPNVSFRPGMVRRVFIAKGQVLEKQGSKAGKCWKIVLGKKMVDNSGP